MNNVIPMQNAQSFAEKLVISEGGLVRYIEAVVENEPCWYFLKLIPAKYNEYKRKRRDGRMMVKEYGEVILCGWGENAPSIAKKIMKKRYAVAC